jgi:hypothetical protein
MTAYPRAPRVIKGGLVLIDPKSSGVRRVITLQYNPDSLSRTLQVQAVGGEGPDRSEALRLRGPPIETIKLDAEIDATDQLEFPESPGNNAPRLGLHPELAALETMVYPSSAELIANNRMADSGSLEIAPTEAPLTLFVWSKNRIVPVRITDFSVTEEAFDPALNPIRVKVSLGMRVLNVNDVGFDHKGGNLFMAYQRQKERLAELARSGNLSSLGISEIP